MSTFSFTSGHQNVMVYVEVHADAEAPVEQVCAELEPPAQELDTQSKTPENEPHNFVFSSEPTAPLCRENNNSNRTNCTTYYLV